MTATPSDEMHTADRNRQVVTRLYADVFTDGKLEVADELVAPGAIDLHDAEDRRGPARVKEVATMLRAAFPDQQWEVHRLVAEGEHVAMYSTWSGTHQGQFMGIAATGASISVPHLYLFKLEGGQVCEYAAVRDDLGMLRQLGALG